MAISLAGLTIADPPERWRALGFTVSEGDQLLIGEVTLQLGAPGRGITGWALDGLGDANDIDGLPTASASPPAAPAPAHDNGALGLDHVVVATPDFDRTAAALADRGLGLRRESQRDGRRQGFRRVGPAILELVHVPELEGPARFWGLVVIVSDLDALHARLAPQLRQPRDAIQPGRRIATLDKSTRLSTQVAFMDPRRPNPDRLGD